MRLVYLSPVPWASFKQRPHKFVEWFHSRHGTDVLWVEPYPGRLPVKGDLRRFVKDSDNKKQLSVTVPIPPWLSVIKPVALPIEPVPVLHLVNRLLWARAMKVIDGFIAREACMLAIGKPSDMAIQVLARHPAVDSVYDAMDDFPEFHHGISRTTMRTRDRMIASRVAKILVSSTALVDRYDAYRAKLSIVRNACSVEDLPPVGGTVGDSNDTVLGYIGTISHWFDWDLVISMAESNKNVTVRLIGPNLAPCSRPLPDNIDMQPACRHEDAIEEMRQFTVGLIPFKRSVLTDSVDPIKYYEYRSIGLPVLTTNFGEMSLRKGEKGVYYLDDESDNAEAIEQAVKFEYTQDEIMEFRADNSWHNRFDSSDLG